MSYYATVEVELSDQYVELDLTSRYTDKSAMEINISGESVSYEGYVSAEVDIEESYEIDLRDYVNAGIVSHMIDDGHIDTDDLNIDIEKVADDLLVEEIVQRMISNETCYLLAKVGELYGRRTASIARGKLLLEQMEKDTSDGQVIPTS